LPGIHAGSWFVAFVAKINNVRICLFADIQTIWGFEKSERSIKGLMDWQHCTEQFLGVPSKWRNFLAT
jgi:hypothetical protein